MDESHCLHHVGIITCSPDEVAQCLARVKQFYWRFDYFSSERRSFQFRVSHDQRNAHRGIQKIRFMDQIVIAVHLPVVGSEQDDSPVAFSSGFDLLENFSDMIVALGTLS